MKGPATTGGKGPSQSGTAPTAPATPVPSGGAAPVPAAHAAPSVSTDGAPPGSPGMPQSWMPQNAFAPPETPYTPFVPPQAPSTIVGKFWSFLSNNSPNNRTLRLTLVGGGFKYFLMFTPTWGNDPIWKNIFGMGWFNHQLELVLTCVFCLTLHLSGGRSQRLLPPLRPWTWMPAICRKKP